MTTYYKIRHKGTGLYSKGGFVTGDGTGSGWNKTGKVWHTLGRLRGHLTMLMPNKWTPTKGVDMSEWEVIEIQIVETAVKQVHEIIDPKKIVQMLSK